MDPDLHQVPQILYDIEIDNTLIEALITNGDDVQKLCIVQNLPTLYQFEPNATVNRILPKIQQELPGSSSEFNIAAARIFQILIQKKVPVNLLASVLQGIDSKDPLVATTWIETLLDIISHLTESQIKNEVLRWAVQKSAPSKSSLYRVASCHVLGRCAVHPKIQSIEVKTTILPLVQCLAQDVSYEVRACMAGQLANIAQGLNNPALLKTNLLPCVVELAKDANGVVRSSAIVSIAQLLHHLATDTKQEVLIPLFKDLCNQSSDDSEPYYPILAKEFGKYMIGLQNILTPPDSLWFLKFFKLLSAKGLGTNQGDNGDPTQGVYCRHFCAQSLPAVTSFTLARASTSLDVWYSIFRDLAADPCYIVRKSVAGCLHEIVGILGIQCRMIKPDIVRLLRDDAEDVLYMVIPKLGITMETLANYGLLGRESSTQTSLEIGRAILKCHMELSKGVNWRMQTDLLVQLEHLPNCFPSDFIHQYFTPIIFSMLGDQKAKPVKAQSARLLLIFLRYNIKEIQRKWIRENLMNRLYLSTSCYTRHIFVKMCESAMGIFSRKYFKDFFFQPLLSYLEDKVSNIRLTTVKLLPQMKGMLGPEDKVLHQIFDTMVKKLDVTERDKDVITTLKCAFKRIQLRQFDSSKPEAVAEEKQKQEDEAKIAQGKIVENLKLMEGLLFTSPKVPLEPKQSKTPPANFPTQSKLSFLEQHFYTDAGINLPIKDIPPPILTEDILDCKALTSFKEKFVLNTFGNSGDQLYDGFGSLNNLTVSVENIDLDGLSEIQLKNLEFSTTNITDDVKVNLRKINSSEAREEAAETRRKLLNRRSLSNLSRIPVSLKNARNNYMENDSTSNKPDNLLMREHSKRDVKMQLTKNPSRIRPKSEVLIYTNYGTRESNISGDNLKSQFPPSNNLCFNKRGSVGNLSRLKTEIPILRKRVEGTSSHKDISFNREKFDICKTIAFKESKMQMTSK